jgi:hypothetical protein
MEVAAMIDAVDVAFSHQRFGQLPMFVWATHLSG